MTDAHGNEVPTWLPPVEVLVYGAYPRTTSEPLADRDEACLHWSLLVPASFVIGSRDRVVIGEREFEVEGDPLDYTRGPFGWAAGTEVYLKRTEG
ncbi:hypothetical protein [Nocardioides ochotonae]|uniref:hypothetical protein n=1 Tax=Nocardioides ochotonae TaxID=2685869 RepID=UPI0014073AC8|nr:hypothetical protein [Nocardioides ochotonae]